MRNPCKACRGMAEGLVGGKHTCDPTKPFIQADPASSVLHIRATPKDKSAWVRAANRRGKKLAVHVTDVLNAESANDEPEDSICYQNKQGVWRTLSTLRSEREKAIAYIESNGGTVSMINGHWHKQP